LIAPRPPCHDVWFKLIAAGPVFFAGASLLMLFARVVGSGAVSGRPGISGRWS
jgi:hypothetical protein